MIEQSEPSISECLPDEQLYAVHPDHCYADIMTYLVAGRIPEGWTKNDKDRLFHLVNSLFGMTSICLSTVLTKSLGGAFSIMR